MSKLITVSESAWDKLEAVYEAAHYYHYISGRSKDATKLFAAIEAVQTKQENLTDAQQNNLNPADSRLSKLHPDCRGPWEKGDTHYPTGEHITDCEKCLEWNRHPDRQSVGEGQRFTIGIDLAKEGSDETAFRCNYCNMIVFSADEADQHECDSAEQGQKPQS